MKKQLLKLTLATALFLAFSSCTKSRKAELPEDQKANIFSISEFGQISEQTNFKVQITSALQQNDSASPLAIDVESKAQLHKHEVSVPEKMKFMFDRLPLYNLETREFDIAFSVDREYLTVYKISRDVSKLTLIEKSIAVSARELQEIKNQNTASAGQLAQRQQARAAARAETNKIKARQAQGGLFVPLFKYKIASYGKIERIKNDLKEETAQLRLKPTEWAEATHVEISSRTDAREMVGMSLQQREALKQIYNVDRINNQIMTSEELQSRFSISMRFIEASKRVFTRLDAGTMHVYEITDVASLTENQRRLLQNNAGNQEIISCRDASVAAHFPQADANCVLVLKADVPVVYKNVKLNETNDYGSTSADVVFEDVSRNASPGLVEIKENVVAVQVDASGALDPNSALKISDLRGDFFYRRTFESASNMFLGRTGTSGDMILVNFELEDDRLVVRNKLSLINYTGQGSKDREEIMSFPVKYVKLVTQDAAGNTLSIPRTEQTTKERAEYALVDWTKNTIPDANSPLAFYADGSCFGANTSLNVTDMDMRLGTDGVLNYSLSGSYTVRADPSCVTIKETNSLISGVSFQFNFNVKERISFMKHKDKSLDTQFTENISNTSQGAFNFGLFTLADKVTGNGRITNRDGSEKYMPMVHDFRNGKKLVYHLGGINNPEATPPERRAVLVEAAQQVVAEWNKTLRYAFRHTSLARQGDYIELVIDDANTEKHLGDLDRNYIWFNELPSENGLLGVAQPAANPYSGIIMSSNVIVYTGNTFDYTEQLLKATALGREYERTVADLKAFKERELEIEKQQAAEDAQAPAPDLAEPTPAASAEAASGDATAIHADPQMAKVISLIKPQVKQASLRLSNKNRLSVKKMGRADLRTQARDLIRAVVQNNKIAPVKINLPAYEKTFVKKLTEIALDSNLRQNKYAFEFALTDALIKYGGLDAVSKEKLNQRSKALAAALRFEENNKHRAGCFMYSRDEINDNALSLDQDPHKNLMLNFKQAVMSTLSHEIGHAIGLHHNFKASTDKENFEFDDEKSGRNYSSIMDYIPDIEQHYVGPGPYDAHALRAGYTGLVEIKVPVEADKKQEFEQLGIPVIASKYVKMSEILESLGMTSYVQLTKDSLNRTGWFKHYAQCDDLGVGTTAFCARHDIGTTAQEIVQNKIADYNRGYHSRYFVYDRINFGWTEKMQTIRRNIEEFAEIRLFLDEAIFTSFLGAGRTDAEEAVIMDDLLKAAKLGYEFFHQLIRTPNTSASVMRPVARARQFKYIPDPEMTPEQNAKQEILERRQVEKNNRLAEFDAKHNINRDRYVVNDQRFTLLKVGETEDKKPIHRLVEARAMSDKNMFGGDRDKFESIGISFDKLFAMSFLLEATDSPILGENQNSQISYIMFEKGVLQNEKPEQSLIVLTMLDILRGDLKYGYFNPTPNFKTVEFVETGRYVPAGYRLSENTAVAAIASLAESRQSPLDLFAEMFKVNRSPEASAPSDRLNVAKAGQVRGQNDTKVMFAAQNALAANVLISTAAKTEFYQANREPLFAGFNMIFQADSRMLKAYGDKIKALCQDPESETCRQAKAKPLDEFISADAQLKAMKDRADAIAAQFVAALRAQNTKGLVIDPEQDKPESELNLDKQMTLIRSQMQTGMQDVFNILIALRGATPENLSLVFQAVNQYITAQSEMYELGNELPLFATAYALIAENLKEIKINIADGKNTEFTGKQVAGFLMNTSKVADDYAQQMDVIEKLSLFSSIVDPDTVLQ